MASLSGLIQDYINEISEDVSLEEHVSCLEEIGQTITKYKPSSVEKVDIENLIEVLFKIRLAMISNNLSQEKINAINNFIADLTTMSYKEPKQRTPSNNLYLLNLGKNITDFTALLKNSNIIIPTIIAIEKIMEYLSTNNYTQS